MKNFFKKKIVWVPLLIVAVILVIFGTVDIEKVVEGWKAERMQRAIEADLAYIEELERNDFYGGKTTEETIDLFIEALKTNDPEAASKYYQILVQDDALLSLKEEKAKYGNLQLSIDYFTEVRTKGTKNCVNIESDLGGCVIKFTYITTEDRVSKIRGRNEQILIPKGSEETKSIDLVLNHQTNIWKLEQPY